MQCLMLLLLLREQPPFLEIWATGAGELGQLLFLSCPSERRGQPRTAAAHGPHRSLGKDPRGPALPLTSSAPSRELAPLGAGVGHLRSLCCRGAPCPGQHSPHAGCRSSGASMVSSAAPGCRQGGPPSALPRGGTCQQISKATMPPSLPAAQQRAKPLWPRPQQGLG